MAKLKVTLVKSTIGSLQKQRDTVKALGLRKMHHEVIHDDNPVIRGMLFRVRHLVNVEEIEA